MNPILQKLLIGIGEQAAGALPGGQLAVKGIENLVGVIKGGGDTMEASLTAGVSVLDVLEKTGVVDFADEPAFQSGLQLAKTGFTMMIGAVKAHQAKPKAVPTPPAA